MTIPKVVKEHAKTVVAFIATFAGNALVALLKGDTAWPQTKEEWVQYALTSVGAAFSVWLTTNKITQKQIDNDKNVIGGTVVPDAQVPPAVTGPTPWVP